MHKYKVAVLLLCDGWKCCLALFNKLYLAECCKKKFILIYLSCCLKASYSIEVVYEEIRDIMIEWSVVRSCCLLDKEATSELNIIIFLMKSLLFFFVKLSWLIIFAVFKDSSSFPTLFFKDISCEICCVPFYIVSLELAKTVRGK